MENENKTTFCSKKKQQHWGSRKFTGSFEKSVDVLDELQDTISNDRKVNKLWEKLFNKQLVKFKNWACLRERSIQ